MVEQKNDKKVGVQIKDIEKLASLARIDLPEAEKAGLAHEIEAILEYVGQIKAISTNEFLNTKKMGFLHNVMREDIDQNETGSFTENLVANMPKKSGNYLKVKKIL